MANIALSEAEKTFILHGVEVINISLLENKIRITILCVSHV